MIKFNIISLIFDDLSPNFLNVSQYQDNTEVKSYPVQSHIIFSRAWWLLCHSTKYLETSPDLFTSYIDFILPQTLFAQNSVKTLNFSKEPPKRYLLQIKQFILQLFLSELSQLVIFRYFSTFLLSNLTYLLAVLLKNCPRKVAWLRNSQASRTSTLKNLLSLLSPSRVRRQGQGTW